MQHVRRHGAIHFGGLLLAGMATLSWATGTPPPVRDQGSARVSLTIPAMVRLSGLDDIDLGTFAGGDVSGGDEVCVYRNVSGAYAVTASSLNGSDAFRLDAVDGDGSLPYRVSFAGVPLVPGESSGTFYGASTVSATCQGGTNAALAVDVSAGDMAGATTAGLYVDVLTLVVESR